MHYGRLRTNGTLERKVVVPFIEDDRGYILVHAPGHPATPRGRCRTYEHRKVFYDAHGPGPHACTWCGKRVEWDDLHVDHFDNDKAHNDISNLLASCGPCNQERGDPGRLKSIAANSPTLIVNGETKTISQWARQLGIKSNSLRLRLANGWPPERAVTEPRGRTGPNQERAKRMALKA